MEDFNPLLCPKGSNVEYPLCKGEIKVLENKEAIKQGWDDLKSLPEKWKTVNIAVKDKYFEFIKVYCKICDINEPFLLVHSNCYINCFIRQKL